MKRLLQKLTSEIRFTLRLGWILEHVGPVTEDIRENFPESRNSERFETWRDPQSGVIRTIFLP